MPIWCCSSINLIYLGTGSNGHTPVLSNSIIRMALLLVYTWLINACAHAIVGILSNARLESEWYPQVYFIGRNNSDLQGLLACILSILFFFKKSLFSFQNELP